MKGATSSARRRSVVVFSFNPHAREGRDPQLSHKLAGVVAVSIHTPVKGATPADSEQAFFHEGFNPHAREGRDRMACNTGNLADVSIHTPVKGATNPLHSEWGTYSVSIHTPVKGATPCHPLRSNSDRGFNPHAREGRDSLSVALCITLGLFQSTRP